MVYDTPGRQLRVGRGVRLFVDKLPLCGQGRANRTELRSDKDRRDVQFSTWCPAWRARSPAREVLGPSGTRSVREGLPRRDHPQAGRTWWGDTRVWKRDVSLIYAILSSGFSDPHTGELFLPGCVRAWSGPRPRHDGGPNAKRRTIRIRLSDSTPTPYS